jgi:hypothetical protein
MLAVDIPGATVAEGSIPVPAGITGTSLSLDSSEIVVTANSEFELGYSVDGSADEPVLMYVQYGGVDKHFVVDLTEPVSRSSGWVHGTRPIRGRPGLTPSGVTR